MEFSTVTHEDRWGWLQWRHPRIGSSDAPIIQGVSRFKTREELLADKLQPVKGDDPKKSYILNKGNEVEKRVREYYSALTGLELLPLNCINNNLPWQIASLDGAHVESKTIIEIKLLSSRDPRKVLNDKTPGYLKFLDAKGGKIPEDYFPQIQHQLAVTGFDECVFIGYSELRGLTEVNSANTAIAYVKRDNEYIKGLTANEQVFYAQLEEARSL